MNISPMRVVERWRVRDYKNDPIEPVCEAIYLTENEAWAPVGQVSNRAAYELRVADRHVVFCVYAVQDDDDSGGPYDHALHATLREARRDLDRRKRRVGIYSSVEFELEVWEVTA